jgi:hypothetical protein
VKRGIRESDGAMTYFKNGNIIHMLYYLHVEKPGNYYLTKIADANCKYEKY